MNKLSLLSQSINPQKDTIIRFASKKYREKQARKGATPFVERMVALQNRLAEANNAQLWDSLTKGTYRKTKHGALPR